MGKVITVDFNLENRTEIERRFAATWLTAVLTGMQDLVTEMKDVGPQGYDIRTLERWERCVGIG